MKRSRYTLIEMLVVMSAGMVVITGAVKMFHEGTLYCRRAIQNAETQQRVLFVHQEWQTFVHQTRTETWQASAEVFKAGENLATLNRGALEMKTERGRKRIILPKGVAGRFRIETQPGLAAAAVLILDWDEKWHGNVVHQSVRLRAAVPVEKKTQAADSDKQESSK